jgi:DNA-binding CsgD family transcriptional regulator/tetratricopeptide (TPR) repeat protein
VELLERHTQLAELAAAFRDAAAGQGSIALVTGEAGVGKTALVREFVEREAATARILWGLCDDLLIPRPLGPLRDMLGHASGELDLSGVVDAVLAEVSRPPHPVIAVIEDAHWADQASLDAIRFLGRRIARTPVLVVVTYRSDEVPADHPLRLTLGAIPPADVRRVRLAALSRRSVAQLAGQADADAVYQLTGGNPFFVREVLAAPGVDVPSTVQDAVMARVGRLGADGHACVELAGVVPSRAEQWLLDGCGVARGVDEAARLGILRVDGDVVSFSNELARRAVEHSLAPGRRQELNQRVLEVLEGRDPEPARLVHHAVQAHAEAAVARFAPLAARRAISLDSHREAADHLEHALRHEDRYDAADLADLLDEYARECHLAGRHERAKSAGLRVVESHERAADMQRLGASLCLLSEVYWHLGQGHEAAATSMRAIAVHDQQPASRELARAYSQQAKLAMVDGRADDAIAWGGKAVEIARRLGDVEVLAHSLITMGYARWMVPPFNHELLVDGLELALAEGLSHAAARAYNNLAAGHTHHSQYAHARPFFDAGLAFCEAHDLITALNLMSANRAEWNLEQGLWADAERDLQGALATEDVSRIVALRVLGQLRTRRGDPEAAKTLEQAQQLAERSAYSQDLLPVACARAELAWLTGDRDGARRIAADALERVPGSGGRWVSELACWLRRAGGHGVPTANVDEPYTSQMAGRWQEAAARWAELGRPYEQADALAGAPDAGPLLDALKILDRLGAVPRAAMVRWRLAEMGIALIPRGPREVTRTNPAGLTVRQTEVLGLLAEDLTYQQIAERLHLSFKTVDHHVSAVRAKLEVSSRGDAVAAGRRMGILGPEDGGAGLPR